jgi:hypothetical protein
MIEFFFDCPSPWTWLAIGPLDGVVTAALVGSGSGSRTPKIVAPGPDR